MTVPYHDAPFAGPMGAWEAGPILMAAISCGHSPARRTAHPEPAPDLIRGCCQLSAIRRPDPRIAAACLSSRGVTCVIASAGVQAAIVDSEYDQVEVGVLRGFAPEIDVVRVPPRRVIGEQIIDVVAAVDRPVIADAENITEQSAVAGFGRPESALAGLLLQRVIEEREIENRNVPDAQYAAVRDGPVVRNDVEKIAVHGPHGMRTIKADDFFKDLFETALEPGEVITQIIFPLPAAHTGSSYMKLENKASHYAVVGCAAVITLGNDGTCTAASIAITGASTVVTRASAVEQVLVGKQLDEPTVAGAATHATDGLDLVGDIHGSSSYRAQMAVVMTRRAILKAAERAS